MKNKTVVGVIAAAVLLVAAMAAWTVWQHVEYDRRCVELRDWARRLSDMEKQSRQNIGVMRDAADRMEAVMQVEQRVAELELKVANVELVGRETMGEVHRLRSNMAGMGISPGDWDLAEPADWNAIPESAPDDDGGSGQDGSGDDEEDPGAAYIPLR